jgi:plasmid maintenance system antidote protein VapI
MNRLTVLRMRNVLIATMLSLVLACSGGALKTFRIGLAASRPLANALVAAGQISQELADKVVTDFDDGAQCGIALQDAFNAAKSLPKEEQRRAKFTASSAAFTCFRAIVQRNNFAQHKRFQDAANIAEGILASLMVFYSDSSAVRAELPVQPTFTAQNEKEMMERLKKEMKVLEEAMKP